jgi:hypothetical protein
MLNNNAKQNITTHIDQIKSMKKRNVKILIIALLFAIHHDVLAQKNDDKNAASARKRLAAVLDSIR